MHPGLGWGLGWGLGCERGAPGGAGGVPLPAAEKSKSKLLGCGQVCAPVPASPAAAACPVISLPRTLPVQARVATNTLCAAASSKVVPSLASRLRTLAIC